jgi:Spy/CpxP family protein refolding chaperone
MLGRIPDRVSVKMSGKLSSLALACYTSLSLLPASPAYAEEGSCGIDWKKLQLSQQQQQQIELLDGQWNQTYLSIQPSLVDDQHKLQRMLTDPKSDSMTIMMLQQSIDQKKNNLKASATSIYLKKRQLLNQQQQRKLEEMIKEMMDQRMNQKIANPGSSSLNAQPGNDRIQNLFQKVRDVMPRQE